MPTADPSCRGPFCRRPGGAAQAPALTHGQPQSSLAGAPETTQQNVCREGAGGRVVFATISNAWLKGDKNSTSRGQEKRVSGELESKPVFSAESWPGGSGGTDRETRGCQLGPDAHSPSQVKGVV